MCLLLWPIPAYLWWSDSHDGRDYFPWHIEYMVEKDKIAKTNSIYINSNCIMWWKSFFNRFRSGSWSFSWFYSSALSQVYPRVLGFTPGCWGKPGLLVGPDHTNYKRGHSLVDADQKLWLFLELITHLKSTNVFESYYLSAVLMLFQWCLVEYVAGGCESLRSEYVSFYTRQTPAEPSARGRMTRSPPAG